MSGAAVTEQRRFITLTPGRLSAGGAPRRKSGGPRNRWKSKQSSISWRFNQGILTEGEGSVQFSSYISCCWIYFLQKSYLNEGVNCTEPSLQLVICGLTWNVCGNAFREYLNIYKRLAYNVCGNAFWRRSESILGLHQFYYVKLKVGTHFEEESRVFVYLD